MTHSPADCERIFPTWRWLIAYVLSILMVLLSLAWTGGTEISSLHHADEDMGYKIVAIRQDVDQLRVAVRDLDSIKSWVRPK